MNKPPIHQQTLSFKLNRDLHHKRVNGLDVFGDHSNVTIDICVSISVIPIFI